MKKILVIATGWHFSSHFYEKMVQQIVPDGWKIDYYCVAHRTPEDENTIKEKDGVRNLVDGHFLDELDQFQVKKTSTKKQYDNNSFQIVERDFAFLFPKEVKSIELINTIKKNRRILSKYHLQISLFVQITYI